MAATLDSLVRVETPEGVELDLRLAGPVPRILAWAIDMGIRVVAYLLLSALLGGLGKLGMGIWLISVFILEWFYPVLFEVYWQGATPGKRALGLRVLHADGTPVAMSASVVRNLLRFVDFLPLMYGFGFVCMVLDGSFRRLGDMAAGTIVVYVSSEAPRVPRPASTAVPPPILLTRAEQRTVMEFAERAPNLTPERAEELARLSGGLVGQSPDAVVQLYAMANYLAGVKVKQDRFAEQNEPLWREFETFLAAREGGDQRLGRRGEKTTSDPAPVDGVASFPQRYRQMAQHLALSRARGYSLGLIDRLERLTLRGHQMLYTRRQGLGTSVVAFVAGGFPRQVRAAWRSLTVSCLIFFGSMFASAVLVSVQPEVILTLLDSNQIASAEAMYDVDAKRLGRERNAGDDVVMFGFYIKNNTSIGFQTFAGGLLAGIGTAFFLLFNGLHVGALAGHLSVSGFAVPFWSFVAGHSAFELSAIVISGAAGLSMGWGILHPGCHRRSVSLMLHARRVIGLVYGAAGLFVLAAFVEAFWSSSTTVAPVMKYAVGVGFWVAFLVYVLAVGHRGPGAVRGRAWESGRESGRESFRGRSDGP